MHWLKQTLVISSNDLNDAIARYSRGDQSASHAILAANARLIISLVRKYNYHADDEDDILSECVVTLLSALPKYNSSRGAISTFFHHVLSNRLPRIVATIRQLHVSTSDSIDATASEPSQSIDVPFIIHNCGSLDQLQLFCAAELVSGTKLVALPAKVKTHMDIDITLSKLISHLTNSES